MKKSFVVLCLLVGLGLTAVADSLSVDFESYALGSVNGQDGWSSTGPYDQEVVLNGLGMAPASFGSKSLRISNAYTSGSFGDMTFTKSLVNEAGETLASNNGMSGGVRQKHFEAQFDMASAVPGAQQLGLHTSVSPDRGDGARMAYLRFEDNAGGIDVFADDVQGTVPYDGVDCFTLICANFTETLIATLDRSVKHSVKFSIDFIDGPSNDVVKVYLDNVLKFTGKTWEDYYTYDPESADGSPSRTVDSLLFRTSGLAALNTLGHGFLFDNFSESSGPIMVGPPTDDDQCKKNGWKLFNNPAFKNQGACVSYIEQHEHDHVSHRNHSDR